MKRMLRRGALVCDISHYLNNSQTGSRSYKSKINEINETIVFARPNTVISGTETIANIVVQLDTENDASTLEWLQISLLESGLSRNRSTICRTIKEKTFTLKNSLE